MSIINISAAVLFKCDHDMVIAPVWKWASPERQRFCVLHLVKSKGCDTPFILNQSIGSLYRQYHGCPYRYTSKCASTECQHNINRASTEHQHSVNWVSTECQHFWVLHQVYSKGSATAYVDTQRIRSRSVQMRSWHGHSTCLSISANRPSTIFWVASCIIQGLCYGIYPYSKYWQPLLAISSVSMLLHLQHQWSLHNGWSCKYGSWSVISSLLSITNVLTSTLCKRQCNMVTAPF